MRGIVSPAEAGGWFVRFVPAVYLRARARARCHEECGEEETPSPRGREQVRDERFVCRQTSNSNIFVSSSGRFSSATSRCSMMKLERYRRRACNLFDSFVAIELLFPRLVLTDELYDALVSQILQDSLKESEYTRWLVPSSHWVNRFAERSRVV